MTDTSNQRFIDVGGEDVPAGRREYDDGVVYVADFGADVGDAAVDVVGDTVIVLLDDEQFEFEVPPGRDPSASIRNGVLTVEVDTA